MNSPLALDKRPVDATAWHIRLHVPYVGTVDLHRIHDGTLKPL
jgi:hypothetical protein